MKGLEYDIEIERNFCGESNREVKIKRVTYMSCREKGRKRKEFLRHNDYDRFQELVRFLHVWSTVWRDVLVEDLGSVPSVHIR